MPIGFHVVVRDRQWFRQWQRRDPSDGLFSIVFLAIDVMAAFTQMLSAGMFERYPRLRCVVLEAGSNWIAAGSIAWTTSTASSPTRRPSACQRARTSTGSA